MPILLIDLLKRVPKEVEDLVRATRDRARTMLRDAIRAECRLSMKTDAEDTGASAQVPIEVAAGYPEVLTTVKFPDELRHILLLTRSMPGYTWLKAECWLMGVPDDLVADGVAETEYDRLSVAYGLSRLEVGKVVKALPQPKLATPPANIWRDNYVDKDQC